MNKFNKPILIIMVILSSLMLTSCWDYKDIENYLTVLCLTIDKDLHTKEFILTIEVVDVVPSTESPQPFLVESRGRTIFEALRNFVSITGRKNAMDHCQSFLIGKSALDKGVIPLLDLIERDVEIRSDSFIFISDTVFAKDLLKVSTDKGELLSTQIMNYGSSTGFNGEYITTMTYEIIDKIGTSGIDPIVSSIGLEKSEFENVSVLKGIYVLRNDLLCGHLNEQETKLINLLFNTELKSLFSIDSEQGDLIVFELIRSKCQIKPKIKDNNLTMEITCNLEAVVSEIEGCAKNYLSKEERYKLINRVEEKCKEDVHTLISKLQNEFNSDILGFGEKIGQKYPNEWDKVKDNWRDEYRKIQCNVNVNLTLRGSALTNNVIKVVH